MKIILGILIMILPPISLYAQKKGYKEILIGSTLKNIKELNKYKIVKDTSQKNTWLVFADSLRMFMTDFDHIEIGIDKLKKIDRITLFPKKQVFDSYEAWLENLNYLILVINGDVNKKISSDVGRENARYSLFSWSFDDIKTGLILNVPDVSKLASQFDTNYTLTWINEKYGSIDLRW